MLEVLRFDDPFSEMFAVSSLISKPLYLINVFTPKPGRIDDFIATQLEGVAQLGDIRGLTASRLFRAEDGTRAIQMAAFESVDAHKQFQQSAEFQALRETLLPLIDRTDPGYFRLVHERSPIR